MTDGTTGSMGYRGRVSEPVPPARPARRRRFRLVIVAPLLILISLGAWAFASPVGAGPDDDFHLVSTWCATGNDAYCAEGTNPSNRYVPSALLYAPCYAFDPMQSAACQPASWPTGQQPDVLTDRGNFIGGYPPVYYAVMSVFVSPDIVSSVVVMRLVNVLLFVLLSTLVFLLLPADRRPTLVWGWLTTVVPLGVFLIASNNPSGWSVTGIGAAWIALLGYYETSGWRRVGLGALFTVGGLMAAGSRGDSAMYLIGAIGVVLILKAAARARWFLLSILPLVVAVIALLLFLSANQVGAGIYGFGGGGASSVAPVSPGEATEAPALSGFGLLAYNLLNLPFLWVGVFGAWGLGWLDTALPAVVGLAGTAVFTVVGFAGLLRMDRRKVIVTAGIALVLIVLPLYVLTRGGDQVGSGVQPRYLLPVIVLFAGVLALDVVRRGVRFGRIQVVAIVGALAISNFISLQVNIRRYVTGIDAPGVDLDAGAEWWWHLPFSPMAVWLVGSIAFAAAAAILVREVNPPRIKVGQ